MEENKGIEEKPPEEVPLQMYGHLPNAIGGVCLGIMVGELEGKSIQMHSDVKVHDIFRGEEGNK